MTSICDKKEYFDKLWEAIFEIDRMCDNRRAGDVEEVSWNQVRTMIEKKDHNESKRKKTVEALDLPKIMEAWQCRGKEMEEISLTEAIDRVSGKYVMIYPPGVPILVPGEKILKETVENISQYLYNGYNVLGLSEKNLVVLKK